MPRRRYVWLTCKGCEEQATFTVTVLAMELHKGHRDRRVERKVLGHYCEKCLRQAEFRFLGREFRLGKERG